MDGHAETTVRTGFVARFIWGLGHQKQITVYHVTEPLASPGNDEADTLAKVRWLENLPVPQEGK